MWHFSYIGLKDFQGGWTDLIDPRLLTFKANCCRKMNRLLLGFHLRQHCTLFLRGLSTLRKYPPLLKCTAIPTLSIQWMLFSINETAQRQKLFSSIYSAIGERTLVCWFDKEWTVAWKVACLWELEAYKWRFLIYGIYIAKETIYRGNNCHIKNGSFIPQFSKNKHSQNLQTNLFLYKRKHYHLELSW